jgi:hypothetical protein
MARCSKMLVNAMLGLLPREPWGRGSTNRCQAAVAGATPCPWPSALAARHSLPDAGRRGAERPSVACFECLRSWITWAREGLIAFER